MTSRIASRVVAACATLAACFGVDRSLAAAPEPYELVRTLTAMQNDIVRGRADALDMQRALILEIAKAMSRFDIDRFRESARNRRAVIKFVLSGGAPASLRRLLAEQVFPDDEATLATAALAYSEARKADADEALSAIDHRTLPRSLGGHVALVKALMMGPNRQDEADALLDDARLLSPGTIVDEASLRRQIELASSLGKRDRFRDLTARYLRRFPASQYSKGMLRQVAGVLGATKMKDEEREHQEMGRLLQNLPPALNHWVMGEIAEISLGQGNLETTLFALDKRDKASALVGGEKESQRMQLYEGAALVVTDAFDRARTLIETTDPRPLRNTDRALLKAAMQVADEIRKAPPDVQADMPLPEGRPAVEGRAWVEENEAQRIVALAADTANKMGSLLEKASK